MSSNADEKQSLLHSSKDDGHSSKDGHATKDDLSSKDGQSKPSGTDKPKPPRHGHLASWLVIVGLFALVPLLQKASQWQHADLKLAYLNETVEWSSCGQTGGRDLECTSLQVPMDHFGPEDSKFDKTFEIPLIRLRGQNATHGRNLIVNPGGPGGSGVDYVQKVGAQLSIMVGEDYHIVSFDPRGVNGSRPQALCYPDHETRQARASHRDRDVVQDSPDLYAWAGNFAQACADTTGEHGAYVNTPQTAADMNSILDALGQEKLVYWGISYGTLLGQTYAMMYPGRVGRMIIDGVANVFEYYTSEPKLEMMTDVDKTFEAFFEECVKTGKEECPLINLSSSKDELYKTVKDFGNLLRDQPLSVYLNSTHYGTLDWRTLWHKAVFEALYMPSSWHRLADHLHKLLQGNATDFFLDHGLRDRAFSDVDAFHFIMSNDGLTGPDHWPQDRESLLKQILPKMETSPFASSIHERYYIKQQWRLPRTHSFDPLKASADKATLPPMLILSQRVDPVTPLVSARRARETFPRSRLVEIQGYGHCSIASPSECAIKHVRTFLDDGVLPAEDVECEVDGAAFTIPGREEEQILRSSLRENPESLQLHRAQREFVKNLYG